MTVKGLKKACYLASIISSLTLSTGAQADLNSDFVSHYAFNTGSGNAAADYSGNGITGSLQNNPQWVPGVSGTTGDYALEFDGLSSSVNLGPVNITGQTLTLSAWFKVDDFDTSDARIISKAADIWTEDHYWMISTVSSDSQYKLRFRLKTDQGGTATLVGNSSIPTNTWTHVAVTYDGSAMRIYRDGVEEASLAKTGNIATSNIAAWIGDNPVGNKPFDGLIDDVRLYQKALTSTDVQALFAAQGDTSGDGSNPPPADTTPDAFSFTDQTDVEINTQIISNSISITGTNTASPISITGGEYSINGGAYTSVAGTVDSGQTVQVRHTSSTQHETQTDTVLTIGGVSDIFSSTTAIQVLPPNTSNLIGHYRFNDGFGLVAQDTSGSGFNGTIENALQWVSGVSGTNGDYALDFDGQSTAVNIGSFDITGTGLTISGWFRADGFGVSDGRLVSKAIGIAEQDHYWMVSTLYNNGQHTLRFRLKTDQGGTTTLIGNSAVSTNTWTHFAASYDGSQMRLYINGVEDASIAKTGNLLSANVPVSIGDNPVGSKPFDGLIDDVRFYQELLDNSEIQALHQTQGIDTDNGSGTPDDTTPDAFGFSAQSNVGLNTQLISNTVTITGINTATDISITGGEYSIDGGAFTNAAGTVNDGQDVEVRHISSALPNSQVDTVLTVGDVSGIFSSTTLAADTTPDAFSFIDQTDVALNAQLTSNIISVSGINSASPISITGGEYSIDGGAYVSTPATVINGQSVRVRHTSAITHSTSTDTVLTIGTISDTFSSTTLAADTTPDAFNFVDQINAPLAIEMVSNSIVVSGLNTATSISITGGEYAIDGGVYVSTPDTIGNGQSVLVRHTSASTHSTQIDTVLTIGTISDTFSSTTLAADTVPDVFSFVDQLDVELNAQITSNTIVVSGTNTNTAISIVGGEYAIDGGTFTSASGVIDNGQSVEVRHTSASDHSSQTTTTLTIGSVSAAFSSTTKNAPAGPVAASYEHNAMGQRTSKTVGGVTTDYIYDQNGQLLAEIDRATGQTIKEYIYLNGEPVAVVEDTQTASETLYFVQNDHLGTPQRLTDDNQNVVWIAEHKPFGETNVYEDPDGDNQNVTMNLRFPGQYFDQETGLHYNYYRDYDPTLGRYIQSDPIGLKGGMNTYGYVHQNPLKYVDPDGQIAILAPLAGGFSGGKAVGDLLTLGVVGGIFNSWLDDDDVYSDPYGGYDPVDEKDAEDVASDPSRHSCDVIREAITALENRIKGRKEDLKNNKNCPGGDPQHKQKIRNLEAALNRLRSALAQCGG